MKTIIGYQFIEKSGYPSGNIIANRNEFENVERTSSGTAYEVVEETYGETTNYYMRYLYTFATT